MSLTSWQFLLFFTVVFLLYFTVLKKHQAILILISSLLFYGSWSVNYLALLLSVALISYLAGLWICPAVSVVGGGYKRVAVSVSFLLVILGIFKYTSSFTSILHDFSPKFSVINLILPVGLSFYTFQSISYIVDVYRGEIEPEKNIFYYVACVSYFPHIMQGPIGQYQKLLPQLKEEHSFDYDRSISSFTRIVFGFFKKLVIADRIAAIIDPIFWNYDQYTGIVWWFSLLLFAVQLYADFSGYMDIMIGCSNMLGVAIPENFDRPYFSESIAEFWRRWHMTLGQWFKNYLFYPLLRSQWLNNIRKKIKKSGNKKLANAVQNTIALSIVWILIGMWHGAGFNFVLYGIYHGSFIICDAIREQYSSKLKAGRLLHYFRIIRTFLLVTIGYALFRAPSLTVSSYVFKNLVKYDGFNSLIEVVLSNKTSLVAASFGTFIVWLSEFTKTPFDEFNVALKPILRDILCIASILLIFLLGSFGQSSFIYFGF